MIGDGRAEKRIGDAFCHSAPSQNTSGILPVSWWESAPPLLPMACQWSLHTEWGFCPFSHSYILLIGPTRWGSWLFDLRGDIFLHFCATRQYVVTERYPFPSHPATEEAPAFKRGASTNFYSIISKQSIPWRKKKNMEKKNQALGG